MPHRVELHLRIRTRPGGRDGLLDFLREAVPFYERPGGIRIRLLGDAADPERYIEVVEYESEAAYLRDQERVASDPEMKKLLARWRSLMASPPVVETYRDVTAAVVGARPSELLP